MRSSSGTRGVALSSKSTMRPRRVHALLVAALVLYATACSSSDQKASPNPSVDMRSSSVADTPAPTSSAGGTTSPETVVTLPRTTGTAGSIAKCASLAPVEVAVTLVRAINQRDAATYDGCFYRGTLNGTAVGLSSLGALATQPYDPTAHRLPLDVHPPDAIVEVVFGSVSGRGPAMVITVTPAADGSHFVTDISPLTEGFSPDTSSSTSLPTNHCDATNDPLAVAKAFLVAAEADDQQALAHCASRRTPLTPNDISVAASGGWLLDHERPIQENAVLPLGPTSIGYNFSSPPVPRGTYVDSGGVSRRIEPDYQGGIDVAVTKESDGLYYVTAVLGYISG